MKKTIAILFLLVSSLSFGQREQVQRLQSFDFKNIRYGFYLGLHQKGYLLEGTSAKIASGAGFQLGVLASHRLNEYASIAIEPGIISSDNTLHLDSNYKTQMPTTHFTLPLTLKLRTQRINNVRGYLIGGVSYNYNFTADKNKGLNGANPYDFTLTKHNFWGQFGIGTDFYFPFFKFSPSIRGIFGFNNEYNGLGSIAKSNLSTLKSRGLLVTLIFQ